MTHEPKKENSTHPGKDRKLVCACPEKRSQVCQNKLGTRVSVCPTCGHGLACHVRRRLDEEKTGWQG